MSKLKRSTTGCSQCKIRRKKCDETKPQCLRCLALNKACSYEYVEYPESQSHRVKRTKPALRDSRELPAKESQVTSVSSYGVGATSLPSSVNLASGGPPSPPRPVSLGISSNKIYPAMTRGADGSLSLLSTSVASHLSEISSDMIFGAPNSTPQDHANPELKEDLDEDNDSEGAQALLFRAPTLDKNVKENSLLFVLDCYSRWVIVTCFEPVKVTHIIREQVIVHFSNEKTRTRAILIANVMEMFTKNFRIDGVRRSILSRMVLDIQNRGTRFIATPPSVVPALDRHEATRTLDSMIEILTIQLRTQPMSDCIQSLASTAPVFRRACPQPLSESINLPNILLDLSLSLRHFATADILLSAATGQPTQFRYEVPFSLELCDRIYRWQLQGNYGLQWLYGVPDQFVLLFAWINSLSETAGAGDNLQLITWIERLLPQIEIGVEKSGDTSFHMERMAVHECWRYAVQIYLYMVLCKADAHDPRVRQAQQGYMRLVGGIKPGRNPDLHLIISMALVGVGTIEERDRAILRRRILNVREYSERGSASNELLLRLEDIWARTRAEGRVAVWSDLKMAYSRLAAK